MMALGILICRHKHWYLNKAKAGDADAQYNLAICFDEGEHTCACVWV